MKDKEFNESWLNLLSDEERAGVMKTQITETELTKRTATEQKEKSKRELANSESYQFIRGLAVVALAIAICGATCVSYHIVDAKYPGTPPVVTPNK